MTRESIKQHAKEIMNSKWGIILLVLLLVLTGTTFAGGLTIGVGSLVVMGPLILGKFYILEDVRNGKNGDWKDIIKGFKIGFADSVLANLLIDVVTVIPIIIGFFFLITIVFSPLMIVAVIISIYFYAAFAETFYILMREPEMNAVEAMKKSRAMMKGHIWQYVMFILSFIGWFLLGAISFGIAYIWVLPYYEMSKMILLADIYENKLGIRTENNTNDLRECEDDSNNIKNAVYEGEAVPKYCGECGTPIVEGAGFCVNCGKPLQ